MTGYRVKDLFFDRAKVINAVDSASRKVLSKAGAFIRQRARSSMRRRKKISSPGQPPSAHEGSLKEKLYFSYDPPRKSVVVGPVKYGKGTAPRSLEEGGNTQIVRRGVKKTVHVEARPYMGPALAAELPQLPSRWSGAVNT